MNTTIPYRTPLGRPWGRAAARPAATPWRAWLDRIGWSRWQLARARAELLRRAAAIEATAPGHAADLRAAALAGTEWC